MSSHNGAHCRSSVQTEGVIPPRQETIRTDKRRTVHGVEARRPYRRRITDIVQPRRGHDGIGINRGQAGSHQLRRGSHTLHVRPSGRQRAQSLLRDEPRTTGSTHD